MSDKACQKEIICWLVAEAKNKANQEYINYRIEIAKANHVNGVNESDRVINRRIVIAETVIGEATTTTKTLMTI